MGKTPKPPLPRLQPDPDDRKRKSAMERKRAAKRKTGREGTFLSSIMSGTTLG